MNIILFGPNGSGKGTHGAILQKKFGIQHIETGCIFRKNMYGNTDIARRANDFVNRGELVPDKITIPMIMNRVNNPLFKNGWLLDGFPRTLTQAETLSKAMDKEGIQLDFIIEIILDGDIAKRRIMGRRLCAHDNSHPNNVSIEVIRPVEDNGRMVCRVCGCEKLTVRADDQDEVAIDRRLNIYFDTKRGTLAAVNYFKARMRVLEVSSLSEVNETSGNMMKVLSFS